VAAQLVGAERLIACEAMQEHLWRLLLDWPKLLGLPQQNQQFAAWYALLRNISAGEAEMAEFLHEFEREALGMAVDEWRGLDSRQALQDWYKQARSPLAQTLAKLDERALRHGAGECRLLPAWSATEAQRACSGRWSAAFAARPDWQGAAAEAGAWGYYAERPLLREVWREGASKALVRVLARLVDVVEMACGRAASRLDAASPAAGEGVAVVRTARGLLLHHVSLAAGQVADYAIVAPTEWNFHPAGVFAQGLLGIKERDKARLQQLASIEALSLDPCVAYEIEVVHA
jgi:hypothetical protein